MNKQVEAVHSVGRPTMKDVASKAGVALKTVSRVVNGEAGVTPETAKRVQGAIEDLGFRRNESARLLRTGQTATLGFIADDWTNADQAAVYRGLEDVARANGYLLYSGSTDRDAQREEQLALAMCARRVDGLIIIPTPGSHDYLVSEIEAGVAAVFVLEPPALVRADAVLPDERGGARTAVAHLIANGHRRIGLVSGGPAVYRTAQLLAGYTEAMAAAGLTADPAWTALTAQALPGAAVTAVLCADRAQTEAVLRAIAAAGPDGGHRIRRLPAGRPRFAARHRAELRRHADRPDGGRTAGPAAGGRAGAAPHGAGAGAADHARFSGVPAAGPVRLGPEHDAEQEREDRDDQHDRDEHADLGPGRFHLPGRGKVVLPPRGEGLEPRCFRTHVTVSLWHAHILSRYDRPGGANASARSTSLDRTITLRVRCTNGSAAIRSTTCSKCLMSAARMCTRASASPVIVQASATSGCRLTAAAIASGEVDEPQNSSTYASVVQPSAAGSTRAVNPVIAPETRSRSTRRLTAGADRPTSAPITA